MANVNCQACEDLREVAPSLACGGFTDDMCTSLQNDTGLTASSGNNDCTDLDNMNDCLIGNEDANVELFEVCDWKKFMHEFIPNLWTMLKAIICAICGIWTNIHNLWTKVNALEDKQGDMCDIIGATIAPPMIDYGTFPLNSSNPNICGTATAGKIYYLPDDGTLEPATKAGQGIGISYGKLVTKDCDGRSKTYEWIEPRTYYTQLEPSCESGDILWKCDKATFQAKTGMTDALWNAFTVSSWTWRNCYLLSSRREAWLKVCIGAEGLTTNEIGVVYKGTSYPNDGLSARETVAPRGAEEARMYTF